MAPQTNGHSDLLDRPGSRELPTKLSPTVRVNEAGEALLVRMPVTDGMVELSVPLAAACRPRKTRHHIPGCNPDTTPC